MSKASPNIETIPEDEETASPFVAPSPSVESSVASEYKRKGSIVLKQYPTTAFREVCSFGFTGETYYDYDKGLDPDHPIVIIHFNDVYNIESQSDGNGGISRFITALRQFADSNPLILFSGDAFNPSFVSTYTKGRHMVPFLNMLKIHTACVGNHDLDFGVDHLEYLMGSTRFPWLLSNIFDAYNSDRPLAGANLYRLFEWQGHRIGMIGLVEEEWTKTLSQVNEEDIIYEDYVVAANKLSKLLRSKECELIIALTHMRAPNDERLAREAEDIDLILGGHDHEYFGGTQIGNSIVCKSGTDFREFSALTIYPGVKTSSRLRSDSATSQHLVSGDRSGGAYLMPRFCGGSIVEWECITVNQSTFAANRHVDKLVDKYIAELGRHMGKPLGENRVPLETRFPIIRTQETNCGNWLADLMKVNTRADVACLNSGTVRSDCIFQPGTLCIRDLVAMLPMPDELVVLEAPGSVLKQMMEVSVSQFPKTEGRFLQISGFRFQFDPRQPVGSRVTSIDREVVDPTTGRFVFRSLDETEIVRICTKAYLADGKDGYDCLKGLKVVMDSESTPNLPTMVQNSFSLAAMASGLRKPRNTSTLRRVDTFKAMSEDQQQHCCGMTMGVSVGLQIMYEESHFHDWLTAH
ncbi:protein 5NUC-like [Condylostylus longicornis]|uniref:protein 5NUC-like n=1 Tax=Condylostylus longicornis TaxID=2530218 RepID=UPI00244DF067|nr:protein 5NUC-like [Condylostylus longicornis]